eukprot:1141825-Pelagomonas_calceolata.AAC.2
MPSLPRHCFSPSSQCMLAENTQLHGLCQANPHCQANPSYAHPPVICIFTPSFTHARREPAAGPEWRAQDRGLWVERACTPQQEAHAVWNAGLPAPRQNAAALAPNALHCCTGFQSFGCCHTNSGPLAPSRPVVPAQYALPRPMTDASGTGLQELYSTYAYCPALWQQA